MNETIFEALTVGVTPRKFWLVLDIPTDQPSFKDDWSTSRSNRDLKILSDLSKGELEGVRGISASKEIMTDWFVNSRNATLILDPEALMSMNEIEEVRYDDVDYLCANNFSVLYRLFQKEGGSRGKDHQQLMMNILPYWISALRPHFPQIKSTLDYVGYTKATYYWEENHANYNIQSLDDAATAIFDMFTKADYGSYGSNIREDLASIPRYELLGITKATFKHIGRIYASEAEWIVNSSHLRIPRGSTLLLAVDPRSVALYPEWLKASAEERSNPFKWDHREWSIARYDRLIKILKEYRLADFYTLKIVDATKFDNVSLKIRRRKRDEKGTVTEGEVIQFPKSVDKMKLAVASLSNFLNDPAPLSDRYQEGDVLELHGEIGTVLYAGKDNLEINFGNNDTRVIPRDEPGLRPAPVKHW